MKKVINGTAKMTRLVTKDPFEYDAKQIAESYSEIDDPLVFDEIKENEVGKKEAFFYDSKCVYYVDEDLEFHYACAR